MTMRAVRGVELFERRIGSGPEVVILHGGPGAQHDYLLPGFDRIAPGRTLIYYDQRGGGRSPVPRDTAVGWREQVADLEALREVWRLERLTRAGASSAKVAEALDVLAAEMPLVLVLEDLHWSDTSTVEVLAYLAQRREPVRLLVLGTC